MRHKTPDPRRTGARCRGQQIHALGVRNRNWQQRECMRDQHEQRIARRVRNAQHFGDCDVFARIPHGRRWRKRHHVQRERRKCDSNRSPIRRRIIDFTHTRRAFVTDPTHDGERHEQQVADHQQCRADTRAALPQIRVAADQQCRRKKRPASRVPAKNARGIHVNV